MELCRCHLAIDDVSSVKVIDHDFPEGTNIRFEAGTFERWEEKVKTDVPCYYLIAENDMVETRPDTDIYGFIAILFFDCEYHLFSTTPHMYGGYIQDDEGGINRWQIDNKTGDTSILTDFGHRTKVRVKLGQWGQFEAITKAWNGYIYTVNYWNHLREKLGLPRLNTPSSFVVFDLELICELVTMKLETLPN